MRFTWWSSRVCGNERVAVDELDLFAGAELGGAGQGMLR